MRTCFEPESGEPCCTVVHDSDSQDLGTDSPPRRIISTIRRAPCWRGCVHDGSGSRRCLSPNADLPPSRAETHFHASHLQCFAAPREAPLLDTHTIGRAPTFTGDHKDWPEWSFQFTTHVGSTTTKPIGALRWAANGRDTHHCRISEDAGLRSPEPSTVACSCTLMQRKRTDDCEEHGNQQRARCVARIERHLRQQ